MAMQGSPVGAGRREIINFRATPLERAALRAEARRRGGTVTDLFRIALAMILDSAADGPRQPAA